MVLHPPHWSYYFSLEDDLVAAARYVEICKDNYPTYSVHFARLILAIGSEVDVVAKLVCGQVEPSASPKNIDAYRQILTQEFPAIPSVEFRVHGTQLDLCPWRPWGQTPPKNPEWWNAYNKIKHHRTTSFELANLENALLALAGLYLLIRHQAEDKGLARPEGLLRILPSS